MMMRFTPPFSLTGVKKITRQLGTIRRIPDDLWTEIAPILGEEKRQGTRGRPPVPFRKVLDGILCVLRTGRQWKALPREYGSGSTAHRRFRQWVNGGVFQMLQSFDRNSGAVAPGFMVSRFCRSFASQPKTRFVQGSLLGFKLDQPSSSAPSAQPRSHR